MNRNQTCFINFFIKNVSYNFRTLFVHSETALTGADLNDLQFCRIKFSNRKIIFKTTRADCKSHQLILQI